MAEETTTATVDDSSDLGAEQIGSLSDRSQRAGQSTAAGDPADTAGKQFEHDALKETPFKDVASLVKGFKDLQRATSAAGRTGGPSSDATVRALVQQMATMMQNGGAGGRQQEKINPDAFLKQFLADPHGTLAAAMKNMVESESRRLETKYDTQFTTNARENALKEFVTGKGKDLTTDEQDRFLQIVDSNPGLSHLPNALELYLSMLIAEDPAAYAANRGKGATTVNTQGLRDAKGAAGAVVGKGTSVNTQGQKKKDEFDDVLDLFEAETASARRSGRAAGSSGFQPKDARTA